VHSWGVPGLGVKVDALPGVLSTVYLAPHALGVHYGSCFELCGAGHSFIPFMVEIGLIRCCI